MRHALVDDLPLRSVRRWEPRGGHIRATSGLRTVGSQRTTAVASGPASCQLISHIRLDSAGHLEPPGISDTEAVTRSHPEPALRKGQRPRGNHDRRGPSDLRSCPAACGAPGECALVRRLVNGNAKMELPRFEVGPY